MSGDIFEQLGEAGAPAPETAEVKLDLSGHDQQAALEKLGHVLTYCERSAALSLYVSFDPARAGGGPTLFQPVAQVLRKAKEKGRILNALPMMGADKAGIFVRFRVTMQ